MPILGDAAATPIGKQDLKSRVTPSAPGRVEMHSNRCTEGPACLCPHAGCQHKPGAAEAMKKAFITGVTGQDGSYLAESLLDKG